MTRGLAKNEEHTYVCNKSLAFSQPINFPHVITKRN